MYRKKESPVGEARGFFIQKMRVGRGFGQTQPVGFGRPAILQAPFPGPEGNSS
jgi:hypothetical protein